MDVNVAIVIPTFNRVELTKRCVNYLLNGSNKNIEIFICDSNSSDGTEKISLNHNNIFHINVGVDSWWTEAVNFGIIEALKKKFRYILVINDDIEFNEILIDQLLAKAEFNPGKIIAPAQISNSGLFLGMDYSGILKWPKIYYHQEFHPVSKIVTTTNGCCLLIPSEVFLNNIYFDYDKCPHLYGDTEFQIRACYNGYFTLVFSDIQIKQGKSTDYFSKVRLSNLFTFKGSPLIFRGYWKFGKTLFKGDFKFLFFGIIYHYRYLLSVIRGIYEINKNKL